MSGGVLDLPPEEGGPPDEAKRQIITRAVGTLDGLVPEEQREDVVRRVIGSLPIAPANMSAVQMQVTSTQHSGPVPAPDTIAAYDAVVPGAANRMIAMAERDQAAYIASQARQQWLDFSFNALCVLAGVAALGGVLWAAVHLGVAGRETAAAAVAALGGAGIIGAIVNARWKKAD